MRRFIPIAPVLLAALLPLVPPAFAYVEAPHSLGQLVALSSHIVVLRVTAIDRKDNSILFAKVRDLKGVHKQEVIRHKIGQSGFEPREWQTVMKWAEVGKEAVFLHNGNASETCIGNYWYQAYGNAGDPNGWWGMSHAEPFLLRSYAGKVDKLTAAITDILAGKEVVVPCMVDGNKDDLKAARAKIQRLRASLKLQDYNPKRDFAGWGGEDFRRLSGMPGFTHISALTRVDPDAQSVSAIDFDGDGKLDLCLGGSGRVALLRNGGDALSEVSLPGVAGCRAAVWADYNGDGRPDLLLATPAGPKLFTNLGKGEFRDDSRLMPVEPAYNLTCAAWIDHDSDGRPDVLLGNGWHGLRLYRNDGKSFANASAVVAGVGKEKGDSLTVCDIDGDGRLDFVYGAGSGVVARNEGGKFVEAADSGVRFEAGRVGPVFGDYNGDGRPDLVIPRRDGVRLFRNDGAFKFTEVPLPKISGATCAAWGDVDNDGQLDLVAGCLRGPNRFLRNKGDGTFEDASELLGLTRRVFNTQAVGLVDLNGDGVLDMVFNNEGQDACVLLGNPDALTKRTPVSLLLGAKSGVVGGRVVVRNSEGKLLASQHVSGGDGRGGQAALMARFALQPGKYRLEWLASSGEKRGQALVVEGSHVKATLDEKTPKME